MPTTLAIVMLLWAPCSQAYVKWTWCRTEFKPDHRVARTRANVPKVILPHLPTVGIYLAGGGSSAASWRIILKRSGELIVSYNPERNSKSFAKMPRNRTTKIDCKTHQKLFKLAHQSWFEKNLVPKNPTVHYGEILVIVSHNSARIIRGFGPIRAKQAKALLNYLRTVARIKELAR